MCSFSVLFLTSGFSLPASTLLRELNALAIPSLPESDPQILEHWGCTDEDLLDKLHRAIDFGLGRWLCVIQLW